MILIIDEETKRMETFKQYLEKIGYSGKLIGDIDEAYKYIESNKFKIRAIILDIMMPWGNLFTKEETESGILTGYVFYKKIRNNLVPKIPVIIYTALNKADLFRELRREENCSIVHKPDPPSKIITELKKFNVYPK